jgi:hypothetical protein
MRTHSGSKPCPHVPQAQSCNGSSTTASQPSVGYCVLRTTVPRRGHTSRRWRSSLARSLSITGPIVVDSRTVGVHRDQRQLRKSVHQPSRADAAPSGKMFRPPMLRWASGSPTDTTWRTPARRERQYELGFSSLPGRRHGRPDHRGGAAVGANCWSRGVDTCWCRDCCLEEKRGPWPPARGFRWPRTSDLVKAALGQGSRPCAKVSDVG